MKAIARPIFGLPLAGLCSLALTLITLAPPPIPGDWPRLDSSGLYIPQPVIYPWPSYALQVALWLGIIVGLWLSVKRNDTAPRLTHAPKISRYALSILAITVFGFALRLYTLNRLPLIVDEIGFAAHASDILHGQQVPIFAPGHNDNPSVYSWLVAGAMLLFGQNTFALRLVPLAFGTLSIPAMYRLGREWDSPRLGLLAAGFLATYPVHVFYSRMSLYDIADPFFVMLALAFLARALRTAAPRDAILTGMMAGFAQYFYHGSHLLLILMVVYIGLSVWRSPNSARTIGRVSGIILLAFVLVTLPRFAPMFLRGLPITGNMNALRLPKDLGANTLRAVLAWGGQPDVSPFWLGSHPLLDWPALLAFAGGILWCLRRWRDPRASVLLLSLVLTTIFGGAILTAAPLYVRYMAVVPAIALLVALGVEKIFLAGMPELSLRAALGTILILVIAIYGGYVSVIVHPAQAYSRIVPGLWEEDRLAQQAAALPPGTAAVFLVSPGFVAESPDPRVMQIIGIAHYVAAYGERRAIIVNNENGANLDQQTVRLGSTPYVVIGAR